LSALPAVNPKFATIVDFIQKAVNALLSKQSDKVKVVAIDYLVGQGTITREYGDFLLYGDASRNDDLGGDEDE
jgi:hypothetical protein